MRDAQLGAQIQNPVQHAVKVLLRQVEVASGTRHFVFDHRTVGLQHVRHDNRVQQTVVRVVNGAQAVGYRVNAAQTTLEGHRTHAGGHLHLQTGVDIITLLGGAWQEILDQAHTFQRDTLSHWVINRGTERLKIVCQRIHTGRSGQLGRQANGQLGVQNHDGRHHLLVEDNAFDVAFIVGDNHCLANFRAGTGGGGHSDNRQHLAGIYGAGACFPQRALLVCNQCDSLGGINGRATTEGNHAVVLTRFQRSDAVGHVATGGVALHGTEQTGLQARVTAQLQRGLNHRQCGQARVSHQQRRRHAQLAAGFGQLTDTTCPHAHGGGVVPVHAVGLDLHGISESLRFL